jgi:bifunctional isochorismate lyase/aryl carrier protein
MFWTGVALFSKQVNLRAVIMKTGKEAYFTSENIQAEAHGMLALLGELKARRSPPALSPSAALLVLDMQDYFLNPDSHAFVPSAAAIVPGIKRLAAAFAGSGKPVFYTRHINDGENAANMGTWWREIITEKNPLSAISAQLDSLGGLVILKSQYDAFYRTSLNDLLVDFMVDQVVICGVMTHLCCESTARSAFMRGYEVLFAVDGTATYNRAYHQASLLNLSHGFAVPVLLSELLAELGG